MSIRDLTPWNWGRKASLTGTEHIPVQKLHHLMDRMWDDYLSTLELAPLAHNGGMVAPRVDIDVTETEYRLSAELPGVNQEDVEVTLVDGVVNIKGEKKLGTKSAADHNVRTERTYGAFHRAFSLPADIDEKKVGATFDKGILTVTVGKRSEATATVKKVEVKAVD